MRCGRGGAGEPERQPSSSPSLGTAPALSAARALCARRTEKHRMSGSVKREREREREKRERESVCVCVCLRERHTEDRESAFVRAYVRALVCVCL
jgi:hypothetical protein